jgi:hypothetical protein
VRARYWASCWVLVVASVPVAERGVIGELSSSEDCSAPAGSGLSLAGPWITTARVVDIYGTEGASES